MDSTHSDGTDFLAALIPGAWEHRFISANGSRFHIAQSGPHQGGHGLVVLLHGFGQFWWAWRHQLEALGRAGYLAVALDLRGYAASDKPPAGYALPELAADAAAVIGSLGFTRAVVVGQGLGGMVAWTMTATEPGILTGVAVVDAPHPAPATPRARIIASPFAAAHVGLLKSPVLAEHAIERADLMGHLLRTWSGRGWPSNRELETYRALMRVPLAAAKALEQFRWAMGLLAGAKRRRFAAVFERRPTVPVLHIQGAADKLLRANAVPAADLGGPWYECYQVPGAGHFVPEEAPDACSSMLLGWLARAAR